MRSSVSLRKPSMLLAFVSVLSCSGEADVTSRHRSYRIHDRAVVIDAHAHPKPGAADALILGKRTEGFEVDFLTMREGGLDAVFFSVPMMMSEPTGLPEAAQILADVVLIENEIAQYPHLAEIARSPEDISRLHDQSKRAVLLGIEAVDPIGGDLANLERFYDAGIRMVTLSPESLAIPDSAGGDRDDTVLTEFGRRVVAEMNRLGMIIDITHTPDQMQMDIIRSSVKPVVASHSCVRALNDIPRQVPDSILRALAETGGVIGVTFYPGHISSEYPDETVTIEDLVDHIDHIVRVAGVDHVGFGSDFIGAEMHTVGLESAAGLPSITYALMERGYSRAEIEKILGRNLLRVFEAVSG